MPDSPEEPRLSGLARSIDSLFSAPSPARAPKPASSAPTLITPAEPDEPAAPTEPLEPVAAVAPVATPEPKPSEPDTRPHPPHMFPQTQMLDVIDHLRPPPPVGGETPFFAPEARDAPPEPLLTFGGPADEAVEPTWVEPAPTEPLAAVGAAEPAAPGDVERFVAAVDDYVGGDRGERDRIQTLAVGLRERLALDPLADAVEKLVRSAGDPPDRTYLELAKGVMNPAVASRLVQRMGRGRDEAVRAEYTTLCRRLGLIMANSLKGALTGALEPSVRRVYYDALLSMGEISRPVIEAMVDDENRFLARDAVIMLGEIGGKRAVQLVTSALANSDPRVRAEALHALAKLGDAEAGSLALGFLEDSDSAVRLAAAVAAGRLGLERALRPLLHLLEEEEEPENRVLLLQALGELGDPGAVPAIEKHAVRARSKKGDMDVRVAAYRALQSIGTPHARELVQQAANDKDPAVRAVVRSFAREA
jgi:hypothetical protein